jgi:hypothetical protein
MNRPLTPNSGPDEGMIDRARVLAEDLLTVVRGEWEKARQAGMSFGNYQPQQQSYQPQAAGADGQDAYAAYYAVRFALIAQGR